MLNLPANIPLHTVAVPQRAAEGQSDKVASDIKVHVEKRCVLEFLLAEKIAFTDMHQHLLNSGSKRSEG